MDKLEYRFAELRQTGARLIEGTAVRYGDIALNSFGQNERFSPRSLTFSDVILNVQHDRGRPLARTEGGGLELSDSATELSVRAELPQTREADDALELIKMKILRGLSVEFRALDEILEGGIRVIKRAELSGIGLVDRPAYPQSGVSARASIAGAGASFGISFGGSLQCECCPDSDTVSFKPESFDQSLQRDIIAVWGEYNHPLASTARDSLRITKTETGLKISMDIPDTQVGRDLLNLAGQVQIYGRPVVDFTKSIYRVEGGVAQVEDAHLRAILVGTTDANKGWEPGEITQPGEPPLEEEGRSRRRIWL